MFPRNSMPALTLLGASVAVAMSAGCAQEVGDINRVQANYSAKSDFEGVWHMSQTIVDVPSTHPYAFVGLGSPLEKIVWEIQEDVLIAYRSYELFPGLDEKVNGRLTDEEDVDDEGNIRGVDDDPAIGGTLIGRRTRIREGFGQGVDSSQFKGEPIAIFPIVNHFDIQRSYNAATGEQTNVIEENASDRLWNEREYMRVNWGQNLLSSSFDVQFSQVTDNNFWVQSINEDSDLGFYEERDEEGGGLEYFDFVNRMTIERRQAVLGVGAWEGYSANDEIQVRTSFHRLEDVEGDYEPAFYDDDAMAKFGYFRNNRLVYDRWFGYRDSQEIRLAERHNLWKQNYKKNEEGDYVRDAQGRRVPIPLAEREPQPIVYYLSPNYPERMEKGAKDVARDWNRAFTRAVAAVKEMTPDQVQENYGPMFAICHNPVREEDDVAACGEVGMRARPGDLRRSFIFWVDQDQMVGPLGYGPNLADPESGQIISGAAYVYGAAVDRIAQTALEYIRFANGDITAEQAQISEDIFEMLQKGIDQALDPRGQSLPGTPNSSSNSGKEISQALRGVPLPSPHGTTLEGRPAEILRMIEEDGFDVLEGNPLFEDRQFEKMKAAGYPQAAMSGEMLADLVNFSGGEIAPSEMSQVQTDELLQKYNPIDIARGKVSERPFQIDPDFAVKNNIYLAEFSDPSIYGTAREYVGRTDYDNIRNELANRIYYAVMAHEVGHTIGLAHNFQGSYDAANYFDEYWDLREENFFVPQDRFDVYDFNKITQNQVDGTISSYQSSSIMDYHSRFNSDFAGVGKYDEAAVIFGYTTGTYEEIETSNTEPIPQELGFVEVYTDVDPGRIVSFPGRDRQYMLGEFLSQYDARFAPNQHPAHDLHYSTFVDALGGPKVLRNRKLKRFSEVKIERDRFNADRAVNTPLVEELIQLNEDFLNPLRGETQEEYDARIDAWWNREVIPLISQVRGQKEIEVPYMFCDGYWESNTISCKRWDLGADPLEILQNQVRNYKTYYPFTHFRRGRANFFSLSGAFRNSRIYETMPFLYQQWLFNRGGLDSVRNMVAESAAFGGLNFLKDVVTTPEYGSYLLNEDEEKGDYYQLVSYDTDAVEDGVNIYPGEGRRQFTRFDQFGYYWFTRVQEPGHIWDFLFAMQALTATRATAIGIDGISEFRSFILPYYLVFDEQMTELFNGIYLLNRDNPYSSDLSPVVVGNDLMKQPSILVSASTDDGTNVLVNPYDGTEFNQRQMNRGTPVQLRMNWTQRLYAGLYGTATFRANYSMHYIDQARIWRTGTGDELEPDIDESRFELIDFTDPETGITYQTLRSTEPTGQPRLGAELVEKGIWYNQRLGEIPNEMNTIIRSIQDRVGQPLNDELLEEHATEEEYSELVRLNRLEDSIVRDRTQLVEEINLLQGMVDTFKEGF